MTATSAELRNVAKDFPAGVTVVTSALADGQPVGATVSAFASVSLEPPLVLVCLTRESRSARAIRESKAFVVHLLASDQAELASRFASDSTDKFVSLDFKLNQDAVPCLADCRTRLECRLHGELPGGDHSIFLGLVQVAQNSEAFQPLVHANRKFGRFAELP